MKESGEISVSRAASRWAALATVAVLASSFGAQPGWAFDVSLEIGTELRGFPSRPLHPGQRWHSASLRVEPEFYHDFGDGNQRIAFQAFGRLDSGDPDRTHADIRELYWRRTFAGDLDLFLGIRKVFWGVTESAHLVDIINQTDFVENLDTEDKLGQPMAAVSWVRGWGTLDAYVMPFFRERIFPGVEGRLRTPIIVDYGNPVFESGAAETHVDLAGRWSHYIGDFDLGLAYFHGTARDPRLVGDQRSGGEVVLVPHYDQVSRASFDGQWTREAWLWKLEVVSRERLARRSSAAVGGVEYTLYGILGTVMDLGLIAEYQYDDRIDLPATGDNDAAFGGRLTFNDVTDTALLAFAAVDTDTGSIFASVEGSRRVGSHWGVEVEARVFANADSDDIAYALRDEDYVQIELTRFLD